MRAPIRRGLKPSLAAIFALRAARPMGAGTILSLRPAQKLSNLNLALIPQSVISGKVVDEDGEPVAGVTVRALNETWMIRDPAINSDNVLPT